MTNLTTNMIVSITFAALAFAVSACVPLRSSAHSAAGCDGCDGYSYNNDGSYSYRDYGSDSYTRHYADYTGDEPNGDQVDLSTYGGYRDDCGYYDDCVASPACQLSVSPAPLLKPGDVTISWDSWGATSGTMNGGVGKLVGAAGHVPFHISRTTTFTGTFIGSGGRATCSVTVTVR